MHKKEDDITFQQLPQRHLSEAEKQYFSLLLEKSRLNRERAKIVLDKGLVLFFAFLLFAIIAYQNQLITQLLFNLLVAGAVCVLLLSVIPYLKISKREEESLDHALNSLLGKSGD